MNPRSELYSKEYAFTFLNIAIGDMQSAKALLDAKAGRPANALYHVEQACEKSLKAMYCALGLPVVWTHDFSILIEDLRPHANNIPFESDLVGLTEYAVKKRYEEGDLDFEADVRPYFHIAEEILRFASNFVASLLNKP